VGDDDPLEQSDNGKQDLESDLPLRRSTRVTQRPDRLTYNRINCSPSWVAKTKYLEDLLAKYPMYLDVIMNSLLYVVCKG
jgi:hypothetical protein